MHTLFGKGGSDFSVFSCLSYVNLLAHVWHFFDHNQHALAMLSQCSSFLVVVVVVVVAVHQVLQCVCVCLFVFMVRKKQHHGSTKDDKPWLWMISCLLLGG